LPRPRHREVAGRFGHSNTSTAGDIYDRLKKADQAAAEKLDNLMARTKRQHGGKVSNGS
jgi:hypothetical protein